VVGASAPPTDFGQLGELAGGVNDAAVAQAVSRLGNRLEHERELRRTITKLDDQLSKVEM
jgi:hypothetical protein